MWPKYKIINILLSVLKIDTVLSLKSAIGVS